MRPSLSFLRLGLHGQLDFRCLHRLGSAPVPVPMPVPVAMAVGGVVTFLLSQEQTA